MSPIEKIIKPGEEYFEDPRVIWWKIYYATGQRWTKLNGLWAQAPRTGVLVVGLWRADGMRRKLRSADFYWHDPTNFPNTFGMTDIREECRGSIKIGVLVSLEDWLRVLWEAITELQFWDPPSEGD